MAKELPYFKFEPAEYLTKDISFCSLSAQGLFINICSYYWQRNCKLSKEQLLKRLNYKTELDELINEGVIDLEDNNIVIKFLDLQLVDVAKTSKQNSLNGSKGGRPKKAKINPKESENKPTALISLSETKGIREDKIKEDNKIYTKKKFLIDWNYLRTDILKKASHLNRLDFESNNILDEIIKDVEDINSDMKNALKGFFKQKQFPNGQDYTTNTRHFLNKFSVYLQAYHDKNDKIYGKENK